MTESEPSSEAPIIIGEITKMLSRSGSGGGVSLHFDADFAAQFDLEPGTELTVRTVEVDGDVELRIVKLPTGFTIDDLREYAVNRDWMEQMDTSAREETRRAAYVDTSGSVRVSMRTPGYIGDTEVNNITVESSPAEIPVDSKESYSELLETAREQELDIRVTDSEGLWQRLKASNTVDTGQAPDPETMAQLVQKAETVSAQLVWAARSTETTVETVGKVVDDMKEALDEMDMYADGDGNNETELLAPPGDD